MKKDQKTLLYEVLSKTAAMTGDGFIGISESTRRKVAKGLIYEDVSLEDFDLIRNFVLHEAAWDHTKFTTREEITAEIARLEDAKRSDLPSIAFANIDNHIQVLRDKLTEFGDNTINEGLIKAIKRMIRNKKKKNKDEHEEEYEKEKKKEIARRNLYTREDVSFEDVCDVMLESVLDPINKIRCPEIFDKNDIMRPKVRSFINEIVDKFKEHVNFPLNIRNIYMIGSSTGYQYSLTSDIDIEIELGIEAKQKWDIIPIVPKGTFLPGTQKPLNIFILCKDETYDFDKAENVYDVINNKWLKKTDKKDLEIPYQYVRDLASFFMNGCDLSISNYEKDVRELDEYIALDPEKQDISYKEKFEAIDRKLIDVKNDVDQMKMAHHVIFAFENEGYDGNPFKISIQGVNDPDPRYSINNLVYKMLDKHGYNEKMLGILKTGRSKIKEVEKYISENKDKNLQEARDTAPNHCRECGCPTDAGEYVCDDCREKNKKKEESPKQQPGTKVTNDRDQNPGQLQFTFERSISDIINDALLLRENKVFGLTTKKEELPDVKTGDAFKVTFYDNGDYVGEVSVSDDYNGDKLCFAYNIEVKKDLRGQGYGTKIMKHMIDKYHIKSLQVAPDNDVAIHLYKKLGFKKTGEVRMSKTRVDDRMELPSKKRLEPYND